MLLAAAPSGAIAEESPGLPCKVKPRTVRIHPGEVASFGCLQVKHLGDWTKTSEPTSEDGAQQQSASSFFGWLFGDGPTWKMELAASPCVAVLRNEHACELGSLYKICLNQNVPRDIVVQCPEGCRRA